MDYLRRGYTSRSRLVIDGPRVTMRWYRTPCKTGYLYKQNRFFSGSQVTQNSPPSTWVGDLWKKGYKWNLGLPPPGFLRGVVDGTEEDFRGETTLAQAQARNKVPECVKIRQNLRKIKGGMGLCGITKFLPSQ